MKTCNAQIKVPLATIGLYQKLRYVATSEDGEVFEGADLAALLRTISSSIIDKGVLPFHCDECLGSRPQVSWTLRVYS